MDRGDYEELNGLRRRVGILSVAAASERARADRAEARSSQLEAIFAQLLSSSRPAAHMGSVTTPEGSLSDEPSSALVREALRPAELLRALGWPGRDDEIFLPIPVDHRRVVDRSARRSLAVVADGRVDLLRRTLCSILIRAAGPLALTVVRSGPGSAELLELLRALAAAVPAIDVVDAPAFSPRPGTHRLDAGDELPWGWPNPADGELTAVAYVLPGMPREGSGGVLSVVQEARGMRRLGLESRVCIPAAVRERADRIYGNADSLFVPFARDEELGEAVGEASVVIATEHTSVPLVARLIRARPDLICAYYIQDYEPLFAKLASPRSDRALLSYGALPTAGLFAKTHFLRNVVTALHGVPVAKVEPSLDRALFHADRRQHGDQPVTVAAMLRPRTPRRRPAATLESLSLIAGALGDGVRIVTFGCAENELRKHDLRHLNHLGPLLPAEVAESHRETDIFIDASAYQAFGRAGLEAMACGAVPVLPAFGGVYEFAIDGENALLLEDDSPNSIAQNVIALASDRDRLERLRNAGIRAASRFSIERAAHSQVAMFRALVSSSRDAVPADAAADSP